MLTPTQKKTAQAIVNLFETSTVLGDYGRVTLIAGDTGHLTFGRSQTTLGSGNLAGLIDRYCANPGARFAAALTPYQPRFAAGDLTLDRDAHLHNILRATADDPVMRETQDAFFDQVYWVPAERAAAAIGISSPLGLAVVYDSRIHGSWARLRDRATAAAQGGPAAVGEQAWLRAYLAERDAWLRNHSRPDLRATVYRMEALQRLADLGQWGLPLPMVVRGAEISLATLNATPPGCYDGPAPGSRALAVQTPLLRGLDVRLLQLGLSARRADIKADGIFGSNSAEHIRQYQAQRGLPVSGAADTALIAELVA